MTNEAHDNDDFFYGVMLLKEGKWSPHSKYDGKAFGSALIKAESLDEDRVSDGVKVVKLPVAGAGKFEPQDVWISPHLRARAEAKATSQIRDGLKKTQQTLADEHARRKAEFRKG